MRRLVIGSTAMRHYFPGRDPKDFDVFADHECKGEVFWDKSFEQWLKDGTWRVATLNEIYTIKVSHSYWDLRNGSWQKHIEDAAALKDYGAKLDKDLHKLLYKVWEKRYGAKKVDLDRDKTEFFDDAVPRLYDHDSIHFSVAYGEKPLYQRLLRPGRQVAMDMKKVKSLPKETVVRMLREEVYTTALERTVIPSNYSVSPQLAYARALRKTITSLTKGWTAQFMVENYDEFRRPDIEYVKHHLSKKHLLIPLEKTA
jgi:hypothetical protein